MSDVTTIRAKLNLEDVLKAGVFFRDDAYATKTKYADPNEDPRGPIADRINNVVAGFDGLLSFLPPADHEKYFVEMLDGLTIAKRSSVRPGSQPVTLGDMLAELESKFDRTYPADDPAQEEAGKHLDILQQFVADLTDPVFVDDVKALLAAQLPASRQTGSGEGMSR